MHAAWWRHELMMALVWPCLISVESSECVRTYHQSISKDHLGHQYWKLMGDPSIDDPLLWGVLPVRYLFSPDNMRWTLGSHDICFKNKYVSRPYFEVARRLADGRLAGPNH